MSDDGKGYMIIATKLRVTDGWCELQLYRTRQDVWTVRTTGGEPVPFVSFDDAFAFYVGTLFALRVDTITGIPDPSRPVVVPVQQDGD